LQRLVLLLGLSLGPAHAQELPLPPQRVEVATSVKSSPSPFSGVLAALKAGDKVKVIAAEGAWSQIANEQGEAIGWVHSSALQRRTLSLNPNAEAAPVEATSDELALAGRGFNSEVESEFKQNNNELPYDQIDAMEAREVSLDEAVKFLQEGGLINAPEAEAAPAAEEAAPAEAPAEGGEQ
jgi:hypothetical protein